jgi:hypothetical protein
VHFVFNYLAGIHPVSLVAADNFEIEGRRGNVFQVGWAAEIIPGLLQANG